MVKKEVKKFICIRCPRGCEITTTLDGYIISEIKGNICKMGISYVENEVKDPRRIITTTVKVRNGKFPLASVWTKEPIPKNLVFELMNELRKVELEAPVMIEHIVLKDFHKTGVDIVTSGKVEKKE